MHLALGKYSTAIYGVIMCALYSRFKQYDVCDQLLNTKLGVVET